MEIMDIHVDSFFIRSLSNIVSLRFLFALLKVDDDGPKDVINVGQSLVPRRRRIEQSEATASNDGMFDMFTVSFGCILLFVFRPSKLLVLMLSSSRFLFTIINDSSRPPQE